MKTPAMLGALALCLVARPLRAQDHTTMNHAAHTTAAADTIPALAGQDAYGAIAEVVRILLADPTTDWSKVDLERLRQHLIDMNEVVLKSRVAQATLAGGIRMIVTGEGRTAAAIRRMTTAHAIQLKTLNLTATSKDVAGGSEFTVTAPSTDRPMIAKLRGLGFIGIMALGSHHPAHHLAMARGDDMAGHSH